MFLCLSLIFYMRMFSLFLDYSMKSSRSIKTLLDEEILARLVDREVKLAKGIGLMGADSSMSHGS